jgi:hypothetical protein
MKSRVFIAMEMMLHTPTQTTALPPRSSSDDGRLPMWLYSLAPAQSKFSIPNPFSSLRHQLVIHELDKIRAYLW